MITSATSPASNTSCLFTSWKFEHAAIRVPEFDTAVAWYFEKLDFRLVQSAPLGEKMYGWMISPTVDHSFTIELIAGPGAEDRPAYEDLSSSLRLSGWHHVGLQVDSVDAAIAELKRRGVIIVSEPHDVAAIGRRVAFFADPWGNLFELIQGIGV